MLEQNIKLDESKILVTGCAGFIGGALVKRLIQTTNAQVIGVDNLNDYYDVELKKYRLRNIVELDLKNRFCFVEGDIAKKEIIMDMVQEYQPSVIVNLAAQAGVRYSILNPDVYVQSNIIGFYNVLEACRYSQNWYGGVKHLVYASSSSVYGNNPKYPYSTDDRVDNPVSFYAASKKTNEIMAATYSNLFNIPSTGLRFFTVYGPAGRPDMAYYKFTNSLICGKKIQVFNNGNCRRDFTYIDDIVEGILRVIVCSPCNIYNEGKENYGLSHRIYNIGKGKPEELMEFIETLKDVLVEVGLVPETFDLKHMMDFMPMQAGDVVITYADTKELERDFGYRPNTGFREGLLNFVNWYKNYYF